MSKKLFVGNIDWNVTEEELSALFAKYGTVEEATIIKDKFSGRPKGFGFVSLAKDSDADKAIAELDGQDFNGRPIVVKTALPPKPREARNDHY